MPVGRLKYKIIKCKPCYSSSKQVQHWSEVMLKPRSNKFEANSMACWNGSQTSAGSVTNCSLDRNATRTNSFSSSPLHLNLSFSLPLCVWVRERGLHSFRQFESATNCKSVNQMFVKSSEGWGQMSRTATTGMWMVQVGLISSNVL